MTSSTLIHGPRGKPFIGMLPEMMGDMLGMFMNITREFGGIVQFPLYGKAPEQKIGLAPEATLRPKYGMKMNLEPI